jgi:hypothetical protein
VKLAIRDGSEVVHGHFRGLAGRCVRGDDLCDSRHRANGAVPAASMRAIRNRRDHRSHRAAVAAADALRERALLFR